jgi:predicted kinase
MMVAASDVIVIRGAPGVGKSQAAKCLASFFPEGVKIEVDILRKFVISVDWKNQQEHKNLLLVAARLAHEFRTLGFAPVIVVDTFSGDKVNGFLQALRDMGGDLKIRQFALYVSEDILKERLERRSGDEFKDFAISQKLNADVLKTLTDGACRIDTSRLTPRGTAEKMARLLGSH